MINNLTYRLTQHLIWRIIVIAQLFEGEGNDKEINNHDAYVDFGLKVK